MRITDAVLARADVVLFFGRKGECNEPSLLFVIVGGKMILPPNRLNEIEDARTAEGSEDFHPDEHDIVFENVGFGYDDKQVLDGVSFTAKEGEVTALVGPSGSESTARRMRKYGRPREQPTATSSWKSCRKGMLSRSVKTEPSSLEVSASAFPSPERC